MMLMSHVLKRSASVCERTWGVEGVRQLTFGTSMLGAAVKRFYEYWVATNYCQSCTLDFN